MSRLEPMYAALFLFAVFISALSQVMLKKSAMKQYKSPLYEYFNPLVILAYGLLFGTMLLSIIAYRGIPFSLGPILESSSYLYITFFSVTLFHEKLNNKKIIGLIFILTGICIYSLFG